MIPVVQLPGIIVGCIVFDTKKNNQNAWQQGIVLIQSSQYNEMIKGYWIGVNNVDHTFHEREGF